MDSGFYAYFRRMYIPPRFPKYVQTFSLSTTMALLLFILLHWSLW